MTAGPQSAYAPDPREPVLHELPSFRFADQSVTLHLSVRLADDRIWRGQLLFTDIYGREWRTAEILRGSTEEELWQSVRALGQHHLRALYQSLV
jgi:hypothetical protein